MAAETAADVGKNTPAPIARALHDYPQLNRKRFHVPGHSGREIVAFGPLGPEAYRHDLTELEGLDVLANPEGCIAQAQAHLADSLGVAHSFFLVNGSSVGIQAALLAMAGPGDQVLVPRNAHRSVIHGLVLSGAEPVWCLPDWLSEWGLWGPLAPETLRAQLAKHPEIRLVVVTSPTYEGLGSDITELSRLCREHGARVLVDEAHGSLWPWADGLPRSACQRGADVVVQSLHKSAGALTQGAVAHLPQGSRLEASRFQQALNLLHTTSPSYLLLGSLDATCAYLASADGRKRLAALQELALNARQAIARDCPAFALLPCGPERDMTQLYLRLPGVSGEDWAVWMEQARGISFEEATPYGALYKLGIGVETGDVEALVAALQEAAQKFTVADAPAKEPAFQQLPVMAMTPREAFFQSHEAVGPERAEGRICAQVVASCPPGIPVLVPGERVEAIHRPYLPKTLQVVRP